MHIRERWALIISRKELGIFAQAQMPTNAVSNCTTASLHLGLHRSTAALTHVHGNQTDGEWSTPEKEPWNIADLWVNPYFMSVPSVCGNLVALARSGTNFRKMWNGFAYFRHFSAF